MLFVLMLVMQISTCIISMYFYIVPQIAKASQPMLFTWARQLRQSEQQ